MTAFLAVNTLPESGKHYHVGCGIYDQGGASALTNLVPEQNLMQASSEEGREACMLWRGKLSKDTGEYLLRPHEASCKAASSWLAKGLWTANGLTCHHECRN